MRALCLTLAMLAAAVSGAADAPLKVAVSIPPQAWLAQRIGGPLVEIVTAIGPGESPHVFDPTPRHVARLADASLYLAVGVPAENILLPRLTANCPDMVVVDTAADVPRLPLADHGHGHDHGHDQGGDPHVWLSPAALQHQAAAMAEAFSHLDPNNTQRYLAGVADLARDLDALHAELDTLLAPLKGRDLFVLHPAFGYLADAYGLHQVALEPANGDPSPRQLAAALDRVAASGATAVFTQPQVSLPTARALAREAGVTLVILDPMAPDLDDNLRRMARAIREALHGP